MKVAIIKPDHFGDLILSSPAIRTIASRERDTVLFIASRNRRLAQFLFPDIEVRDIEFGHLSKDGRSTSIPDLTQFEMVAVLRKDSVLTDDWARLRTHGSIMPADTLDVHQSLIDFSVAAYFGGEYDIDAAFFGSALQSVDEKATRVPRRVGLSIGSGFHANAWPAQRWVETARDLLSTTDSIVLLCGPAERDKATLIAARLGWPKSVSIVEGGGDIASFVSAVDDLDLVVASDGGTAHLCSLVTPIVSIFGPSPFRRYAPFGRFNRLLTRRLPCAPCCQYAAALVNGCLTTECMTGIAAKDVGSTLASPPAHGEQPRLSRSRNGVDLYLGVSHLHRDALLDKFSRAMSTEWAHRPDVLARMVDPVRVLASLQEARIDLIEAVDRLRNSPEANPGWVGATLARLARLHRSNTSAATYLDSCDAVDTLDAFGANLPPQGL